MPFSCCTLLIVQASAMLSFIIFCATARCGEVAAPGKAEAYTIFQTADFPSTPVDFRSDAAVVYGVDDRFSSRVQAWQNLGYRTEMMTGAAWGNYSHYIDGSFDGVNHTDEGQVDPQGNVIWHHPGVPYMVPSDSFVKYLISLCRKAIDAGVEAVHLEEPEFWSRAGYSESFKREWVKEYGEPWRRPDSSPDAFWRSSKLKYLLYKRTLERVFADAKTYAASKGQNVRCYVPTHSLVSYSQWAIVSPESSLMDLNNCDGYIAQVWTGTARTPNHYRGVQAERTFETAFLEYSSMYYMVAPTGRTVYFLADPVEDDPNHTWDDYRSNYHKTVAASLLFPQVHHFEVMPWPDRVFTYKYPAGSYSAEDKITIPESYAAELLTVINALNDMQQTEVQWDSGSQEVGVMVSDTMMFQRGNNWGENGPIQFNAFYGVALPLVKAGVPVKCLVLERCMDPKTLEQVKLLYLSYEAMKPLKPEYHERLSEWVRSGGRLVYVGDDSDPFHSARDWWNADGSTSGTAREHLFSKLDAPSNAGEIKTWTVGKGQVTWHPQHPAKLAMDAGGPETVARLGTINKIETELSLNASPHIRLQRGPYVVGAVLHESSIEKPMALEGEYIDLFSSGTVEVTNPLTQPGNVFLFRSLNEPHLKDQPEMVATTARAIHTTVSASLIEYHLKSSSAVKQHQILLRLQAKPAKVEVDGAVTANWTWVEKTNLLRVKMSWRENGMRLTLTP